MDMDNIVLISAWKFVLHLVLLNLTMGAEYKFDVTVFDNSPVVGASTSEEYRVYLPRNRRDATFAEIGRYSNTGTGDVGQGYMNPADNDNIPNAHGFPSGSTIDIASNSKWRKMQVDFPSSSIVNRVGVFYATTTRGEDSVTIPMIKISETATITPHEYTKTIGIGEYVTLSVTSTVSKLRWIHNNGEIITAWNDLAEVTLDHVRLADAGIYECFEDGKRDLGQHAIMRLIVRACPSPKYGPNCSDDCATCWNGGVCAADNGVCLCQPGFAGDQCEQRLGSNYWGAQGSLRCSSSGGNCRTALICGPDPIGCSCVAGYSGLDCTTACPSGWYGSNCNRQCHCSNNCNTAIGCTGTTCDQGYQEFFCQGKDTCEQGYFGAQCEFSCHCNNGDSCDKSTGMCSNTMCADGWDGKDCQQALPYFYDGGEVTANASSTTVSINWNAWNQAVDYGTGPIDHYTIYYWEFDSTDLSSIKSTTQNAYVSDLLPETIYNFAIAAVKSIDGEFLEGSKTMTVSATTGCGVPLQSPIINDVIQIADDQAKLTWMIPGGSDWIQCSQGLNGFVIEYKGNVTVNTIVANPEATEFNIESLAACTKYEFRIKAGNKDANRNYTSSKDITILIAPKQVKGITLRDKFLKWDEPESTCRVTDYVVKLVLFNRDQCEDQTLPITNNITTSLGVTLPPLQYFSTYAATIQARSGNTTFATGDLGRIKFITEESAPTGSPENITHETLEEGQLSFSWDVPACAKRHGKIIKYEYEHWIQAMSNSTRKNTTAKYAILADVIIDETYVFHVRAYTTKGPGPFSTPYNATTSSPARTGSFDGNPGVVGGVVGLLLVLLLVIVLLMIFIYRKRRSQEKPERKMTARHQQQRTVYENTAFVGEAAVNLENNEPQDLTSQSPAAKLNEGVKSKPKNAPLPSRDQPVELKDVMEYVKVKKTSGPDHEMKKDFEELPQVDDKEHPWTVAKKPENKTKNRYKNIVTYDHSRVILEKHEGGETSDYINASYINGYKQKGAYIASQGPNSTTVKDMWRMVWQEQTETVIMVTSLVEGVKIKCEQYWPNVGQGATYGDYTVTNTKEDNKGLYVVRHLTLIKTEIYANQQSAPRYVKHFHYTGWPDMRVPEFAEPVLKFLEDVNLSDSPDAGPIVVHCSAGIGRTGTFISIDAMLKMAKAEGKVDVFNFVKEMRHNRPGMIQTEIQYAFVHDALLEALFCGNTTIPTSDVDQAWKDVEAAVHGEDNHILGQFMTLTSMFPALSMTEYTGGNQPENKSKIRCSTLIPPDSKRPKLSIPVDENNNGFVNASFCHGYEKRNVYLTTQVPLPHTMEDFWRLIYDYELKTIVTLNDPDDTDKTFGTYWPFEESLQCGQFVIESISVEQNENTNERKLRFYHARKSNTLAEVQLIQYTDWRSSSALPSSASSFVRLLDRVNKRRHGLADQRVAVVNRDGVTRCGVFCAVMSVVDQIKEKQEVDVFRAVKRLKVCRQEMISTMEQYTFCYEAARAYLRSFETYANFM